MILILQCRGIILSVANCNMTVKQIYGLWQTDITRWMNKIMELQKEWVDRQNEKKNLLNLSSPQKAMFCAFHCQSDFRPYQVLLNYFDKRNFKTTLQYAAFALEYNSLGCSVIILLEAFMLYYWMFYRNSPGVQWYWKRFSRIFCRNSVQAESKQAKKCIDYVGWRRRQLKSVGWQQRHPTRIVPILYSIGWSFQ